MAKRAVRIHPDLDQRLQKAARDRGYRTPSAFIRAAIESEIKSRDDVWGIEEQTAASFDRLTKELRRVLRGQQAVFALLDALTKVVLTCVAEPPVDTRPQAIAGAKERYTRLMKAAGQTLVSGALSSMQDLTKDVQE